MKKLIVAVSALTLMSGLALAEARTLASDEEIYHAFVDAFLNREDASITSAESGKTLHVKTENGFVTAKAFDKSGQQIGQFAFPEELHKFAINDQATKDALKNQIMTQLRYEAQIRNRIVGNQVQNTVPAPVAVSGDNAPLSQAQINQQLRVGQAINLAIGGIPDASSKDRPVAFGTAVGHLHGETAIAAGVHARLGESFMVKGAFGTDFKLENIGGTIGIGFSF